MPFYEALKILMTQNNIALKRKDWETLVKDQFIIYGFDAYGNKTILICTDGYTGYPHSLNVDDIVANDWYIYE